jgi:branched-chain amino acid transport system substrate-binding protein
LRERLAAQRMLALYRSGRQSDALEAYAQTRRLLNAELGLEPGPDLQRLQRQILDHEPVLELRSAGAPRRRGRLLVVAAAAAGAVAAVAAVMTVALIRDDRRTTPPAVAEGHVLAIDAETGDIRRSIGAGRTPAAVAADRGSVWVVDGDARTVVHVTERSRVVETLSTGGTPTDVAVGAGSVWVANGRPLKRAQFVGAVATSVVQLDPATRTQRADIALPAPRAAVLNRVDNHLAVAAGAVWAITPDGVVVRIDARTGSPTATFRGLLAHAVAAGGAGIWVLGVDGRAARLDPRTARQLTSVRVPSSSADAIAVGKDSVWITSRSDGTLWRVEGGAKPTLGSIELSRGITDVAAGDGAVWVVNSLAGALIRVDPASAAVETSEVDGIPRSVAVDGQTVWVAVGPGLGEPVASEAAGIRAWPAPECEPVVAGPGDADVLITSDLPLQGGTRVSAGQMVQAITFVLHEHRFRAGRFPVAYQSCDDSVGRTGLFDEAKCAANARAYSRNADVVGVIGTLNSACALAALPELNRGPGGALAMVSPLNSFVGLTRPALGVEPGLPASLYPTGRRNYLRVFPTDDLQGAALAVFARDSGRRRVFVLDDGDPGFGALMAVGFETAAGRLGLTVAGKETWDPRAKGYAALADRVAAARPDAVFLGGLLDTNGSRVVRDLRARLGPSVALLVTDGFTPLPLFVKQARDAAIGAHVSLAGVVVERLPPAGARFVRRFGRTQAGTPVEPSAVYAAQATEVLLDAIARSDGTRSSVIDELFATRMAASLLGTFGFDANGDITESPITILRVARGGSSTKVMTVEGGEVERVVRPAARLVAAGR